MGAPQINLTKAFIPALRPRVLPRLSAGPVPATMAENLTIGAAFDRWFAFKGVRWTKYVRKPLRRMISTWLGVLGDKRLSEVTSLDIETLYSQRDDGHLAGATLNLERKYFRGFWRWALRHRLIPRDNQDFTDAWPVVPEDPRRKLIEVSRGEEEALLPVLGHAVRRFFLFAIYMGLRINEIYHLTWGMVSSEPKDPERWILNIPSTIRKQRRSHRMPISDKAKEQLGPRGSQDDLIFKDLPGQRRLAQILKEAAEKVGADPAISPHQLRRTWLSRMAEAEVPIGAAQKLQGWRTLTVMLKHYYLLRDEKAREYMNRI